MQIARPVSLAGRKALITGIANDQSIAWGCAQALSLLGADVAITYLNDKARPHVEPLARQLNAPLLMPLDVRVEGQLETILNGSPQNGDTSIACCIPSPLPRGRTYTGGWSTALGQAFSPRWTCPAGPSSEWPIWRSR
jgi:hypothetical protein